MFQQFSFLTLTSNKKTKSQFNFDETVEKEKKTFLSAVRVCVLTSRTAAGAGV